MLLDFFSNPHLTHKKNIKSFIKHFAQDDNWHELDDKNGNLGYAWVHYSYIRLLKPQRVLCVGSRYGLIPASCALACRDNGFGVVDFVDASYDQDNPDHDGKHWGGVGFWHTKKGKNHFKKFGLNNFIKLHVMTTQKFFKKNNVKHAHKKKQDQQHWDYAHLDGDHSYKGVKFDFDHAWPRIKKGGMVTLHDINTPDTMGNIEYGVAKIWQEIKDEYNTTIELPGVCGLGLVQKTK